MKHGAAHLVAAVLILVLGIFFFWPLALTLEGAFRFEGRWTLAFFGELLAHPLTLEGLRNSLLLALATTALVIAMGLPLATIAARCEFRGKAWLTGLILLPMILPPFVGAIGIRQILGPYGALNAGLVHAGVMNWSQAIDWLGRGRFWAVAVTQALHLYPIFYLNATAALAQVDPSLEEAAAALGCTGWRRFRRITLPLMMPGLFAGGSLVFIWAFTELGTPLMFDFPRTTAVQIYDGLRDIGSSPLPYAQVVVMLAVSAGLYLIGKGLFGPSAHAMLTKGSAAGAARRLSGWRAAAAASLFGLVLALALVPHAGVLLASVSRAWYGTVLPSRWTADWFREALSHPLTLPAIRNSCLYAFAAMCLDVALGVAAAVVIVRGPRRWRGALDTLVMIPLAVPGLVLAFGYLAMSQPGRLLAALNPTDNPTILLIAAYAVRRLPYVVRAAVAGLQQTAPAYEEAAWNLGCPPTRALVRITLPLIGAHLVAGALLAFSFALLEVSDSLMLAQKQAYFPVTKALFELSQVLGDGPALATALGVWAMVFIGLTLLLANRLLGRRLGSMFRL